MQEVPATVPEKRTRLAAATGTVPPPSKPQPPGLLNSVLTVGLKDVKGAKEGGQVSILSVGLPIASDVRWQMSRPGGGALLRLRNGLRGRRTISARGSGAMAGRSFEFWVERLDARGDKAEHAGPLWVARELPTSFHNLGRAAASSAGGPSKRRRDT
jgi:hypothetical protein